ncbi:hypothetical protein DPMN_125364 [Dreissena polymorpha]|uniref:Sushi domain-containing protein n=1 Tax=Dreissena polymorpha TaxID=45954 RepID=A0A9D4GV98_DREPO|nr:hypothetical protein DPMN_125364 [Dreissena polymorpha]
MLYGTSIIICFGTQWSEQPPMCIAPTCPKIGPTSVLRVHDEYTGAIATFSCAVGHKLVGDEKLICTGINWNKLTPKCKPACLQL